MLVCPGNFHAAAVDPAVGLVWLNFVCQIVSNGKAVIIGHGSARIGIAVFPVIVQMLRIVRNGAGLPFLVLGPGVLRRVGNGDDALPLIVQNFAHVHIQSSVVRHGDFRRAVRRQDPALAGAGDPARQIDLASRRVDILHKQLLRGGIPIDLRHIVKSLIRIVPLRTALIDFVHSAVLHDRRAIGRPFLRRSQVFLRYRGDIVLVAALDQTVHIDIGGGHIDIPPGDIACGLRRSATRVRLSLVLSIIVVRCAQA